MFYLLFRFWQRIITLKLAKQLLQDLIQIKSTESAGLATRASEYASEKLRSAGFDQDDLKIVGPTSTTQGLIATLKA